MARRLAFERFDRAELRLCRYLNRSSSSTLVRQLFRAISWLGDGWVWYGLLLALPLIYGVRRPRRGAHGHHRARRRRDLQAREDARRARAAVHHALGDPLRVGSARPLQFPVGAHATRDFVHAVVRGVLPCLDRGAHGACILDRAVARVLGLHYPTDVAAGALLGGALAMGSLMLASALESIALTGTEAFPSDQAPDQHRERDAREHGGGAESFARADSAWRSVRSSTTYSTAVFKSSTISTSRPERTTASARRRSGRATRRRGAARRPPRTPDGTQLRFARRAQAGHRIERCVHDGRKPVLPGLAIGARVARDRADASRIQRGNGADQPSKLTPHRIRNSTASTPSRAPADQLELTVQVLHQRRAALDPVSVVAIDETVALDEVRPMDVPANDAVEAASAAARNDACWNLFDITGQPCRIAP